MASWGCHSFPRGFKGGDGGLFKEEKCCLRTEREIPISAMRVNEAKDCLRLRKNYSTTFPSRKQEGNMFPPRSLVCYTDGSCTGREYSGAGIYLENSGILQSYSLGSHATLFQAKVFIFLIVGQREDVKSCTEEKIFICSECGDALESLARQKEVGLVWVPGHMSIPGNERADQLAYPESGNSAQVPEPILETSKGSIKRGIPKIRNELEDEYRM
ncbi:hypothetical protein NQ315_013709 [Exocentrus adspersus]|uniref:RNase H type-1 domain-containing protein n=1 Tax=Exocentrus adspersus TaxID=1586481 RepID=A0AAV8W4J5_9CUCU|nr:hypothetical protein NQ315_013709 [Exocentrus adspersus]